ncbi:MAG: VOC family protein [Clostridiales bacterium]|nr:VOC family protein [Clostridiales bacterium]
MQFKMVHNNLNVADSGASLAFYEKALGLRELRRKAGEGFTIVFLGDGQGAHQLELTELADHPQKYDLGENEIHLAFETADFDAALAFHHEMGCVCYENPKMGIYFIEDPDGYWLEIVPKR